MTKLNQKILNAINEGIRKSLLSFDDVQFDQSDSNDVNQKVSKSIKDWKWIQDNFVDLGLPSGNLWMNYNLGATCGDTADSWVGNYYAWGEVKPKKSYVASNYRHYKYRKDHYTTIKYVEGVDNITELQLCDDAANQIDKRLCIPTKDDFEELLSNTFWYFIDDEYYNNVEGLTGCLLVSRKDNTKRLFIPCSGSMDYFTKTEDYVAFLWTASIGIGPTSGTSFTALVGPECYTEDINRTVGLPIRAIYKKEL